MPIDIENLNPSTKFPYPLLKADMPESEDEWVSVRSLSVKRLEEIDEKTTKSKSEFIQPKKANGKINKLAALQRIEFTEVINKSLRNELMWDAIIDEIHIKDANGSYIPTTKEIKIKLMSQSSSFAMYIADCLEMLAGNEEEEKRELEKNFTSSQPE